VIQAGDGLESSKPMGVDYRVRTFVGDSEEDPGHKRSSVNLAIKKLQFAPILRIDRLPSALASKSFTFSQGRVSMEITLNKEVFYHGESILATLTVTNNSRKTVKNLKLYVMQHVELTMVSMQLIHQVASLETKEGCPITPGNSFSKEFILTPQALCNKDKRGIALDGYLKDDDVNLASSTIVPPGKSVMDSIGIVIGYTVRGKLGFGTLGGELVADVPLKLVHRELTGPSSAKEKESRMQRIKSMDRAHYEENANDEDENIEFDDFGRNRFSENEE